jgi:transcriptional regulator with XRE-family HTH domain
MSGTKLAGVISSSKSEISRIENGYKLPSRDLTERYEDYFGTEKGKILKERDALERGEWPATHVPPTPTSLPSEGQAGAADRKDHASRTG